MLYRIGDLLGSGMAKVNDFRDFDAFKASRSFVREIGQLVRTPSFAPNRNFVNQMERAAISVLSNFAEGYERDGNSERIRKTRSKIWPSA